MNILEIMALLQKYGKYVTQFIELYKKYGPVLMQLLAEVAEVLKKKENLKFELSPEAHEQCVKEAADKVATALLASKE